MHFLIPSKEVKYEIEIKRSKFLAYLFISENIEDVKTRIAELKKEHYKARHICYAAFFGNRISPIVKSNDDGEPSGTAGKPILEAIIEKNVHNTIVVVVRYFGGVKLGASGLTRAYHSAASGVLENCFLIEDIIKESKIYCLEYDKYESFKRECTSLGLNIIDEDFKEKIKVEVEFELGKEPLFPYGMVLIDK